MHLIRCSPFFTALLLALPLSEAIPVQADTPDSDIAICIYRISGQYSTFMRWLYYALLLSAVFIRRRKWLEAGILVTGMLYSSASVVHAWVILGSCGRNPEVLDLDIIPITTITLSTLLLPLVKWFSPSFGQNKAGHIISLWIGWIWLGSIACGVTTWILGKNPRGVHFTELVCVDDSGPTVAFLRSAAQLSSRNYNFSCTNECFSSRASIIHSSEEIVAARLHDIYPPKTKLEIYPENVFSGVGIGFVLLVALIWQMRKKATTVAIFNALNKWKKLLWASYLGLLVFTPIIPILVAIGIGEALILRRERLLKTGSYKAVGQWTPFVWVFLVSFVTLLKYIFEPRRRRREELEADEELAVRPARPSHESWVTARASI